MITKKNEVQINWEEKNLSKSLNGLSIVNTSQATNKKIFCVFFKKT